MPSSPRALTRSSTLRVLTPGRTTRARWPPVCSLGPLAWFQQPRKEATVAHAWHVQIERTHPSVPVSVAVAIGLALPLRAALVALGTQVLGHLEFHQGLGHHAHALAQGVQVGLSVCLAQQLRQSPCAHAQPSLRFSSSVLTLRSEP